MTEQENLWEYYFILFESVTMPLYKPFQMGEKGFAHENHPYIGAPMLRKPILAQFFRAIKFETELDMSTTVFNLIKNNEAQDDLNTTEKKVLIFLSEENLSSAM